MGGDLPGGLSPYLGIITRKELKRQRGNRMESRSSERCSRHVRCQSHSEMGLKSARPTVHGSVWIWGEHPIHFLDVSRHCDVLMVMIRWPCPHKVLLIPCALSN